MQGVAKQAATEQQAAVQQAVAQQATDSHMPHCICVSHQLCSLLLISTIEVYTQGMYHWFAADI